ncbi:MAG: hypothetical protein HY721_12020 [Planctomycetes bacterium]|nr:hypothetical protein [Planctomycetota bacterium]
MAAAFLMAASPADAQTPEKGLEKPLAALLSGDAFERERAQVEILRFGQGALGGLVKALESPDRLFRFRAERLFTEALDGLLAEVDSERQTLVLDQNEIAGFAAREQAAAARKELNARIEAARKENPAIRAKLDEALELERLEVRERRAAAGKGPALEGAARQELERLRRAREDTAKASPSFEELRRSLLRVVALEGAATGGGELKELEVLRRKELEGRIADRLPKVEALERRVEEVGLPALNGVLARSLGARDRARSHQAALVSRLLEKLRSKLVPPEGSFEGLRYTRGLLWVWEVERRGPLAEKAREALERHLARVLEDLQDLQPIVRERAADELYLLGRRGLEALERAGPAADPFLGGLLRWRIRPRTYSRVGEDFSGYGKLSFQEKRRRIFAFARAAQEDAIPTLRAIVEDDGLEPSFFVKLAAAKALAGLRDMTGYQRLVATHPEMTLKKPEVSREILIIQSYEHIRDKEYQKAVEELQQILDQHPFDFSANYHIAFAYLLLKSYAKSVHHFEIARRINPQDQLTLYNLACAYALSGGKSEEALEALEASVKAGFDDHEHIEKDPDLESLREHPRYQRLLEEMKGGAAR